MKCEEWRQRLDTGDEAGLPPPVRQAMQEHETACLACRAERVKQDRAVENLQKAFRTFDPLPGKRFRFSFPEAATAPAAGWFDRLQAWVAALLGVPAGDSGAFVFRAAALAGLVGLVVLVTYWQRMPGPGTGLRTNRADAGWVMLSGEIRAGSSAGHESPGLWLVSGQRYETQKPTSLVAWNGTTALLEPGTAVQVASHGLSIDGTGFFSLISPTASCSIQTPNGEILLVGGTGNPMCLVRLHATAQMTAAESIAGLLTIASSGHLLTVRQGQTCILAAGKQAVVLALPRSLFSSDGKFQGPVPAFPETPVSPVASMTLPSASPSAVIATAPGEPPADPLSASPPVAVASDPASPTHPEVATAPDEVPLSPEDFLKQ